jgi:ADP-heptose:LPS heptosyltransferase
MKSWQAVRSLRRQQLDFHADVAIDMQGLLKSAVPTWLSGASVRIGHARPESRECAWLASTHVVPATAAHVVDRNCDLLEPLGVRETAPAFGMPDWPVSRHRMEEWLTTLRLASTPVVINPGAGWPSKIWPEERFAAVARTLHDRHRLTSIIVWGGDRERGSAERIAAAAPRATVVAPQTSLQDLGALCRLARLFVSGDTGPLHLAAAVGTPCVGLFGPVPADRNGPYGRIHTTVEPPAALRPKWDDRKTDTHAMAGIDVGRVVAACERLAFHDQRITA